MFRSYSTVNQSRRIAEFYHGKSIFLTGATGFIGSVLLVTLLRCCPGIKSIYILLRTKKNVEPEARKEQIFRKKIFEKLRTVVPELLGKVRVISGDVSLPNLGMNENDTHLLLEEISIIFHCAAATNFKKPLEFLLKTNVLSVSNVIELCRKMRKFEVLVYTSTAYSNCNHKNFPLKEEVYRLPFHAGKFLDALKTGDREKLQELIAHCKPEWPNMYCFSKCLAENVMMDTASDLPIAIMRPSIVFSTWKHPISGYVEENSGMVIASLGIISGLIKVANADPNCKLDLVPADIVANAHVLAAWSVGLKRCSSPFVVNCTATENLQISFGEYIKITTQLGQEFSPSLKQKISLIIVSDKHLYRILFVYYHYLPAIALDGLLRILGKRARIYSRYRFLDMVLNSLNFFVFHSFEFERNNFAHLDILIQREDRKDLTLEFRDATFLGMAWSVLQGSTFYNWNMDKKSLSEIQRILYLRRVLIRCIQVAFLTFGCLFTFWVISSIFF